MSYYRKKDRERYECYTHIRSGLDVISHMPRFDIHLSVFMQTTEGGLKNLFNK
jgi:hypothetical protein